jgi:hypothetical protein
MEIYQSLRRAEKVLISARRFLHFDQVFLAYVAYSLSRNVTPHVDTLELFQL